MKPAPPVGRHSTGKVHASGASLVSQKSHPADRLPPVVPAGQAGELVLSVGQMWVEGEDSVFLRENRVMIGAAMVDRRPFARIFSAPGCHHRNRPVTSLKLMVLCGSAVSCLTISACAEDGIATFAMWTGSIGGLWK